MNRIGKALTLAVATAVAAGLSSAVAAGPAAASPRTASDVGGVCRVAGPEQASLVANGSFEDPESPDSAIPGWHKAFGADEFVVTDADAADGDHSLYVASAKGNSAIQSDPFPVQAGTQYAVAVQTAVTGAPHLVVRFMNSSGAVLASPWTTIQGTGSTWSRTTFTVAAPDDAATAQVRYTLAKGYGVTGYLDDVTFRSTGLTAVSRPVRLTAVNYAAVTQSEGTAIAYLPMNGNPDAEVAQIDLNTGEIISSVAVPGAGVFASAVAGVDGEVYLTGNKNGHLYRMDPGATTIVDLGRPDPGQHSLFAGTLAPDGSYYAGSQPGGKLFRYDPQTGSYYDYGTVSPGEKYVYAAAYLDGSVYVGLGTAGAKIVKIDPATGAKEEVPLPTAYQDAGSVRQLDARGDFLFARVSGGPSGAGHGLIVWSANDQQWTDLGQQGDGSEVISNMDPDGRVWFRGSDGLLRSYDPTTEDASTMQVADNTPIGWTAKGLGVVELDQAQHPGKTVVAIGYDGKITYYNPQTHATTSQTPDLVAPTEAIRSLLATPDGQIYASGYQNGQLAAYNTSIGEVQEFPRGLTGGQGESMLYHDGLIYMGTYSGANVSVIDPAQQTSRRLAALSSDDQDRPFAIAWAGDRLAIGTVPTYGVLGGALALVDPINGGAEVHRNIIPDQSITALATSGRYLVGGTSVAGGLGSTPTQTTAELFVWDLDTDQLAWSAPLPGETAVAELTVGPDGHVWGATMDTLFEFDPATRTMLRSVQYTDTFVYYGNNAWGDTAGMGFLPDGQIWLNNRGIFFIDPATLDVTKIMDGMAHAVLGADGNLYFNANADSGPDLYRLTLDCSAPRPDDCVVVTGEVPGPLVVGSDDVCVDGATVAGRVSVSAGGSVYVTHSELDGGLVANGASSVTVRQSSARGPLMAFNSGAVSLADVQATGPVTLTGNTAAVVAGNTIRGPLACSANASAPSDRGFPNSVSGRSSGQCSRL